MNSPCMGAIPVPSAGSLSQTLHIWASFSASVMRASRSLTRSAIGSEATADGVQRASALA